MDTLALPGLLKPMEMDIDIVLVGKGDSCPLVASKTLTQTCGLCDWFTFQHTGPALGTAPQDAI